MAEVLTPESPVTLDGYRVQSLLLDWAGQSIKVWVRGPSGVIEGRAYTGARAVSMMRTLNTANLATKSLHRRVLEVLSADGMLPAGTVSGVPE